MTKTFFNLIQEVQKPGLCHYCGGCVTFCTAINYGALELDENGRPRFKDMEKCIECGLCYLICPEIHELDDEQKKVAAWSEPIGRVLETKVARSRDPKIREVATDGGVVTALLLHLFDLGFIDGAIVTRQTEPFKREPWLARSREEIIEAAGFHFDTSAGMHHFSDHYSTYVPSILELGPMAKFGLHRVAFVGTPCQIKALRRMEALGVVPAHAIRYHFGLFCSGNFEFGPEQAAQLEQIGEFNWDDVRKINIKRNLKIHLQNGQIKAIPLGRLEFMKRYACRYCDDYSAEYADISFGGIGAVEGWTTVIIRSPVGRAVYANAKEEIIEEYRDPDDPHYFRNVLKMILEWSERKKDTAERNRDELVKKGVTVKS